MCSQGDGWIHVVRLNAIQLEIAKTDSLYRSSPNGETSPFLHLLIHHFSVAYDWSRDCIAMVGISVSRRGRMLKIQRSANGQGGPFAERPNSGRKRGGVAEIPRTRKSGPWFDSGLERRDARRSGLSEVPRALRSRQHRAQELSGLHPRMD